jgi:hypothetical protein
VILDGVAIPQIAPADLAWLLSPDDDAEADIDPELAKAQVYLGSNELASSARTSQTSSTRLGRCKKLLSGGSGSV